jgi:hypothetical protein
MFWSLEYLFADGLKICRDVSNADDLELLQSDIDSAQNSFVKWYEAQYM